MNTIDLVLFILVLIFSLQIFKIKSEAEKLYFTFNNWINGGSSFKKTIANIKSFYHIFPHLQFNFPKISS